MLPRRLFADFVLNDSPNAKDVGAALDALGRLLHDDMRARHVLDLPPAEWDYIGKSWHEEATFNKLLRHCFRWVFYGTTGKRLVRWRQYARVGHLLDGPIRRAVRNFLNDLEKAKDPEKLAVFKNIQAAVVEALEEGQATADNASEGVTQETVVRVAGGRQGRASLTQLREQINRWSDGAALCQQLTSRSSRQGGVEAAAEALERLGKAGRGMLRVGDLVEAVQQALPAQGTLRREKETGHGRARMKRG
jgi:hypothetical protein